MQSSAEAIAVCEKIYRETAEFYEKKASELKDGACGFRVLYSPIIMHCPVLFVGYQPGGIDRNDYIEHEERWPDRNEYVTQSWHLALKMREIFDAQFLENCMATNAIFFRARNVREFRAIGVRQVKEIAAFSYDRLVQIIFAVKPQRIIFIGMNSAGAMQKSGKALRSAKGRLLIQYGDTFGIPSLAVLHLSGARISSIDRDCIDENLRKFANS